MPLQDLLTAFSTMPTVLMCGGPRQPPPTACLLYTVLRGGKQTTLTRPERILARTSG